MEEQAHEAEGGPGPAPTPEFKKPVLIGRIGKLPRKVKEEEPQQTQPALIVEPKKDIKSNLPPAVLLKELSTPIPYKEPKWSGLPPEGSNYSLEVLKSGVIVDKIDLMCKPYHVFGRLANCDIVMAHPTISRHHAVLQYKAFSEEGDRPVGFYVWDASSTHGTFLNKERVKPAHYARVRTGHMLKLGGSTRNYILLGPDWDAEGESELSVTEMKQKHLEMKLEHQRRVREATEEKAKELDEAERKREEDGISWGMADDAEEETDLSENPYASTANEQLYLDDPKKTLRGYFEREGLELQYDCQEKGQGQFVCRVELPVDDARGNPIKAEAIHRGKKKEAVVACALEACRLLDRHGLLRQAKHESRRRKERDWSADDYYDSDDDTFFERTGAVERKRQMRMKKHGAGEKEQERAVTHEELVKKCSSLQARIASEEAHLTALRAPGVQQTSADDEQDPLEQFMSSLGSQGQSVARKADISRSKMEIKKLQTELSKTQRLADVARPTILPELVKQQPETKKLSMKLGSNSVVYGKRIRLKDDKKVKVDNKRPEAETEFVEEMDSDEEERIENESKNISTLKSDEDTSKSIENASICEENTSKCDENTSISNETYIGLSQIEDTPSDKAKSKNTDCRRTEEKRVFGPLRPPENYVVPENYFEAESDRDLPEIMENE